MPLFSVVTFIDSSECEVVPNKWLINDNTETLWPPCKSLTTLTNMIKSQTVPASSWQCYKVRILHEYDDYALARKKAAKAEYTSDLTTDYEYGKGARKKLKAKRYVQSDDSSDSDTDVDLCDAPKLPMPPVMASVTSQAKTLACDVNGNVQKNIAACSKDDHVYDSMIQPLFNMQKKILFQLASLHVKVDELTLESKQIKEVMSELSANMSQGSLPEDTLQLLPEGTLPFTKMDDFMSTEEKLQTDMIFGIKMEKHLSLLGGQTFKKSVKLILDALFTNEMQGLFNWAGRVGCRSSDGPCKVGLKSTIISSIIIKAAMKNKFFTTTEDEVRQEIMHYLRNYADRCGGRKRRLLLTATHNLAMQCETSSGATEKLTQ